jgi:hypothetical protein
VRQPLRPLWHTVARLLGAYVLPYPRRDRRRTRSNPLSGSKATSVGGLSCCGVALRCIAPHRPVRPTPMQSDLIRVGVNAQQHNCCAFRSNDPKLSRTDQTGHAASVSARVGMRGACVPISDGKLSRMDPDRSVGHSDAPSDGSPKPRLSQPRRPLDLALQGIAWLRRRATSPYG